MKETRTFEEMVEQGRAAWERVDEYLHAHLADFQTKPSDELSSFKRDLEMLARESGYINK